MSLTERRGFLGLGTRAALQRLVGRVICSMDVADAHGLAGQIPGEADATEASLIDGILATVTTHLCYVPAVTAARLGDEDGSIWVERGRATHNLRPRTRHGRLRQKGTDTLTRVPFNFS